MFRCSNVTCSCMLMLAQYVCSVLLTVITQTVITADAHDHLYRWSDSQYRLYSNCGTINPLLQHAQILIISYFSKLTLKSSLRFWLDDCFLNRTFQTGCYRLRLWLWFSVSLEHAKTRYQPTFATPPNLMQDFRTSDLPKMPVSKPLPLLILMEPFRKPALNHVLSMAPRPYKHKIYWK